jgi:hypothetical protein
MTAWPATSASPAESRELMPIPISTASDWQLQPHHLQMRQVVEGRLTCWGLREQGDWWGLVTYVIAYGSKKKTVTHMGSGMGVEAV